MERLSEQTQLANCTDISPEKQPTETPSTGIQIRAQNPIWQLSPRHNGSTLYDSFELQAVTRRLNKAMQGSTGSFSPAYMGYLASPFYRHYLDQIYRDEAKTRKKVVFSGFGQVRVERRGLAKGFVVRLWGKVRRSVCRNKDRN